MTRTEGFVNEAVASWLVSGEAREALDLAATFADPTSLAAATALRRGWPAEQAAAALDTVWLRRRAASKLGDLAAGLFLTKVGLEQATRWAVARWRARRFVEAGAERVIDLCCGLGIDALALAAEGLAVRAVERDPVTAILAGANLSGRGQVLLASAEEVSVDPGEAVFLDPARRTTRGRSWQLSDLSPSWEFALDSIAGRVGCLKAAPGIERGLLPRDLAVSWVSESGDLVETAIWSRAGLDPGGRVAVLLPGETLLEADDAQSVVGAVQGWLLEPDPAVIRSGAVDTLARQVGAHRLAPQIAYLSAPEQVRTPLARCFRVEQVLDLDERTLRRWLRDRGVGIIEIKVRGLQIDPAALRRRLRPSGPATATLVLTPTSAGARALVVSRV